MTYGENAFSVSSITCAQTIFIFEEYLVRNKHKQVFIFLSWLFNDSVSIVTILW
jgi:hypothetical protein